MFAFVARASTVSQVLLALLLAILWPPHLTIVTATLLPLALVTAIALAGSTYLRLWGRRSEVLIADTLVMFVLIMTVSWMVSVGQYVVLAQQRPWWMLPSSNSTGSGESTDRVLILVVTPVALGEVYGADAEAARRALSPEDRLRWHQDRSGPVLTSLKDWMTAQFGAHRVEPNSSLGKALRYLLRHWPKLTRFLEVAGVPLDNNICERALKLAIRNRQNAYCDQPPQGAEVGDLLMSLTHTCELAGAHPFAYLTALQQHADLVATQASAWMPWHYRDAMPSRVSAESA